MNMEMRLHQNSAKLKVEQASCVDRDVESVHVLAKCQKWCIMVEYHALALPC